MRRFALLVPAVALVAGSLARARFRRYAVAGDSMAPALQDGDFVLADLRAYRRRAPTPGDILVARDPRDPSRTLVKRVLRFDSGEGAWVVGDNPMQSTDSREFGFVPPDRVVGRVLFRYWPLWRGGGPSGSDETP